MDYSLFCILYCIVSPVFFYWCYKLLQPVLNVLTLFRGWGTWKSSSFSAICFAMVVSSTSLNYYLDETSPKMLKTPPAASHMRSASASKMCFVTKSGLGHRPPTGSPAGIPHPCRLWGTSPPPGTPLPAVTTLVCHLSALWVPTLWEAYGILPWDLSLVSNAHPQK